MLSEGLFPSSKFSDDIISDNTTLSLLGFGISIPTVLFPGIAETRADTELVFLAISSDKLTIFDTFTLALVQIHIKKQQVRY